MTREPNSTAGSEESMNKIAFVAILLLLRGIVVFARPIGVGPLPESPYADTESTTNIVLAPWRDISRDFTVSLALEATPSNCVELSFGRDVFPADGALSFAETDFRAGWDAGNWFVETRQSRHRRHSPPANTNAPGKTLHISIGVREDNTLRSLKMADGTTTLFAGILETNLFANTWDLMSLSMRGRGVRDGEITVHILESRMMLFLR